MPSDDFTQTITVLGHARSDSRHSLRLPRPRVCYAAFDTLHHPRHAASVSHPQALRQEHAEVLGKAERLEALASAQADELVEARAERERARERAVDAERDVRGPLMGAAYRSPCCIAVRHRSCIVTARVQPLITSSPLPSSHCHRLGHPRSSSSQSAQPRRPSPSRSAWPLRCPRRRRNTPRRRRCGRGA